MSEPQRYNLEPFATDALVPDEEGDFVLWADVVSRLSHDRGADALENDIRELRGAEPGELARRLIERGWSLSVPAPTLPALDAHHPDCAQMSKATKWWGDRYTAIGDDFYRATGRELVMDAEMFHQTHCGEALRDAV